MFYILLTEEDAYPGTDYKTFDIPKFQLENLENTKLIDNDEIKGSFILNVWASWCITCRVEHPFLMNLKNQGIKIIGLNYMKRFEVLKKQQVKQKLKLFLELAILKQCEM